MDFYQETLKRKEEMVKDLQGLIRIPSLRDLNTKAENAPFGKELRNALDYVLDMATKDGFKTRDLEGYAGVVEFGEGDEIMGVLGHLDIVPIGTGWTFDPFGGEIKDGYMIGRGTQDDKGPTIAGYYAMKILKEMGFKPKKRVFLIVGCDEETGMSCMKYYNEHGEIPDFGFVPDADFPVVYGEKGIMNLSLDGDVQTKIVRLKAGERPNICIGEAAITLLGYAQKDLFNFYLNTHHLKGEITELNGEVTYKIYGKFSHGAKPDDGINAAWHCLNFVGSAYQDEFAAKTAMLLRDWRAEPLGVKVFGSHMGYLTMNIGVVEVEHNHAHIILDIRYPNETNDQFVFETIRNTFESHKSELIVSLIQAKEPLFVNPKSTLVSTLETIYRDYSKDMTTPLLTMGGGTYARSFKNFVAFGAEFPTRHRPEWVGQVHQADEGYELEQFYLATAIYAQAIYDLTK